jgi:aminoglycoside phosphotransferase (APT) family kinase protein
MHFLDFRSMLTTMFAEELAPLGSIEAVDFIHRNHADVYRVRAQRGTLIAHASSDGKPYLKRMRDNLKLLAPLADRRIPHVRAWRAGTAGLPTRDWAVLVYDEIPGERISRRNFGRATWEGLAECLARVHTLDGDIQPGGGPVFTGHNPANFPAFADTLMLRMGDLPLRPQRVRAHLDHMAEYVDRHRERFLVPSRMIHGDLDRQNIVAAWLEVGILDWADLTTGDYAFDLGMLKFMLDSVTPGLGAALIRAQARRYRDRFDDSALELRLGFFVALAGLVHAFHACDDTGAFAPARAWRVRTSYLHSEAQWRSPLKLDGALTGGPAARTEQWALDIQQPLRGLFYMLAPKRVT